MQKCTATFSSNSASAELFHTQGFVEQTVKGWQMQRFSVARGSFYQKHKPFCYWIRATAHIKMKRTAENTAMQLTFSPKLKIL